jgi:hypothetical protein
MRHEDIDQAKWVITSNSTKELFVGFLTPTSFDSVASGHEFNSLEWGWDAGMGWAAIYPYGLNTNNKGGPSLSPSIMGASYWPSKDEFTGSSAIHFDPFFGPSEDLRTLAIMNLDGSPGIDANLQLGWRVPALDWLPYLMIIVGLVMSIVGLLR